MLKDGTLVCRPLKKSELGTGRALYERFPTPEMMLERRELEAQRRLDEAQEGYEERQQERKGGAYHD